MALWLYGAPAAYARVIIDPFSGLQELSVGGPSGSTSGSTVAGSAIGGTRDLYVNVTGGSSFNSLDLSVDSSSNGVYDHSQGADIRGTTTVIWDGDSDPSSIDYTGLGSVDLTEGGVSTGLEVEVITADNEVDLIFTVWSDSGHASQGIVSLPGSQFTRITHEVLFGSDFSAIAGGGADFTNVGAIRMHVESLVPATDIQIDIVQTNESHRPNVVLTKNSVGTFVVDDTEVYQLTVSNNGTGATVGTITVTDTLPVGVTYSSATGSNWSCGAIGQEMTCTHPGSLGTGQTLPMISANVNIGIGAWPQITNTGVANTSFDFLSTDNSGSVVTNVYLPVDITVTNTDSRTTITPTDTNTYTITLTNNGTYTATGVTLVDTIPAVYESVTWTCGATAGSQCENASGVGNSISESVDIAVGGTVTFSVTGVLATNTTINVSNAATATVASTFIDLHTDDNSVTDTDTLTRPNLTILKVHTGSFIAAIESEYLLRVSNIGDAPTVGTVTVTDTLPSGLTFQSVTASGWSCGNVGQVVTCTHAGPLSQGQSLTDIIIAVDVDVSAVPSVTNVASVSTPADSNVSNNGATDITTVALQDVDVDVSKNDGKIAVNRNETYAYTIVIGNSGLHTATGVTFTDNVPNKLSSVTWACTASANSQCDNASGVGNTIAEVIDVGVGGSVTYTVTGTVLNTALTSVSNTGSVTLPIVYHDTDISNNQDNDTDLIIGADMTIDISHSGNFTVFSEGVYSLVVSNVGTFTASGPITLTGNIPTGLTYVSATGNDWSCGAVGQALTCTYAGALAVSSTLPTITLTVDVLPAALTSVTTTVQVSISDEINPLNNSDSDLTIINPASVDLSVSTVASSSSMLPDDPISYIVTVTNGSPLTITGAIVTDTVPASIQNVSWSCSASAGSSCDAASGTESSISETVNLLPSGSVTYAILGHVASDATGTMTNTATASAPSEYSDTNTSNNSSSANTAIVRPDITVNKSHAGVFIVNTNGTYTIAVSNGGAGASTGSIVLTDTLPDGLTYVLASGLGWSCNAVGQNITCTYADSLPAGGSLPNITVTASVHSAALPSVTNTATVSTLLESVTGNNADSDVTTVANTPVDLTVSNSNGVTEVLPGDNPTYTVTIHNLSAFSVSGVTFTNTPSAWLEDMTWTCSAAAGSFCDHAGGNGAPTDEAFDLNAEGTVTFTINATISDSAYGSVVNTGSIVLPFGFGDTDTANNTSVDTDIIGTAMARDLTILKETGSLLIVGQTGSFLLTVSNIGTGSTVGTITATDTLPTGLTPVSAEGEQWTCDIAGSIVSCTNPGPLPPDSNLSPITIIATIALAAYPSITNSASVSTPGDPDESNNSGSLTSAVYKPANISISSSNGLTSMERGQGVTYLLVIRNLQSDAINDVIVTDILPSVFITSEWTCIASAGSACAHDSGTGTTVNETITLAGSGSIMFLINTTVPAAAAAGAYTNTASVTVPGAYYDMQSSNNISSNLVTIPATSTPASPAPTPDAGTAESGGGGGGGGFKVFSADRATALLELQEQVNDLFPPEEIIIEKCKPKEPLEPGKSRFTDAVPGDQHYEAAAALYERCIIKGQGNTARADLQSFTNRSEASTMLTRAFFRGGPLTSNLSLRYKDAQRNAWMNPYVQWVGDQGIMTGYDNGSFGFADNLSRLHAVIIAARASKLEDELPSFSHVEQYLRAAMNLGLIPEYLGLVRMANQPITRGEFAEVLNNIFRILEETSNLSIEQPQQGRRLSP